ncbi:MAG TPA: hypothetical protein DEB17_04515 [Chlorobaculum sp.]|uniref:Transposase n=1 Tax=Chlorobaculum tepidum (strain ATCC 49652 / DSM 12025 / NBRC 103806 / TLS) TaxID=194439 RepID=Q8KAK3_CHLTE|nr:hypothetical protein [Chlorobaculum tepidum]AAM73373.1 hypothetical protein CT2157 [Chlorobaculum tepidum TLS]HBU23247.1 hypothetical protein [Chlorobaculum sp.]
MESKRYSEAFKLKVVLEIESGKFRIGEAARHCIGKATALQWKNRDQVDDLPNTPHRFNKTMSDLEALVVIELSKSLLLPLDDLLAIVRECINLKVSRSGLEPLSAPAWRRQPERVDACRRGRAQAQKERQRPRAGSCACRCQIPAQDAR